MKLQFLIIGFLLSFSFLKTSAQKVFENNDLTISKLEKNVWVVETTDMTTMYIIEGSKQAMLIDTGTKCADLDKVVSKITNKPLIVVLTHAHGDHAGNINYFKDIYLHPDDTVLLGKSYKGKVNFVSDGQVFDLGGKKIKVVQTPAHTPGSIILIDQEAGICYSGDSYGSGQVWLQLRPFSPMKTYVESCKKMETLMDNGITKIYCGHYPYIKGAFNKNYVTDMRTLAESLIDGTAPKAIPHSQQASGNGNKAMMVTRNEATIVFDPEHIK